MLNYLKQKPFWWKVWFVVLIIVTGILGHISNAVFPRGDPANAGGRYILLALMTLSISVMANMIFDWRRKWGMKKWCLFTLYAFISMAMTEMTRM